MPTVLIVGLQWGDEGKGKIIDALAHTAHVVMRYQGGANSGHTIYYQREKVVLHHLPSGIFHPGVQCLLGWGMVISPEVLRQELAEVVRLRGSVIPPSELVISGHASVVLPIHQRLDAEREKRLSIGTTQRGIGPAYEDRVGRRAVRIEDVITSSKEQLRDRLAALYTLHFRHVAPFEEEMSQTLEMLATFRNEISTYVGDVTECVYQASRQGQRILFEGAQGVMLDIAQGTYPYVTSSLTGVAGVYSSLGVYVPIGRRVGVAKAYCTRVGSGPFPSELTGSIGEYLQKTGHEFGSTTGRRRRVGWLDLVQLRYAVMANGIGEIILTKADVLSGLSEVGLVTGYQKKGCQMSSMEGGFRITQDIEPVVEMVPGWSRVVDECGQWTEGIRKFCQRVETYTGARVVAVSHGPEREHTAFDSGFVLEDFYRVA